ncbi:uncharacterized protein K452DRAFT_354234 [Aplosporella prunicola CBS 121167]|uniref:Glutamine amidotransferase type-2 domain-containing protein n=1 Tax=Aplosporella prunicola CBS 121167 TaxID=1176127 RepID=A0A6A6AXU4_9PEZI|nr:uncharacterized protein K452DRAFT_354234 [Aplosporella prunicola CBS 121167]KAF2135795.1 hypothetical protein K452DRAFT_354234 [Aplosporella prunicola CBS 121167]
MCWFAYLSPHEDVLLEDVLITPARSIMHQFNIDGVGIAWYTWAQEDFIATTKSGRPALFKTISPPLNDINFRSLCLNTSTRVCFAHIRAPASGAPATAVNCHPFIFGRHTIMHAGHVSDYVSIRRQLTLEISDVAFAHIRGATDSEHLAALYMTYLCEGLDQAGAIAWDEKYPLDRMYEALKRVVTTVMAVQHRVLGRAAAKANSLNLAVTDGVRLVAFRFRNHVREDPPTLYFSTHAGVTLNRKYPDHPDQGIDNPAPLRPVEWYPRHVVLASEPLTYKDEDWGLVKRNCAVLVNEDGTMVMGEIEYDAEKWDVRE